MSVSAASKLEFSTYAGPAVRLWGRICTADEPVRLGGPTMLRVWSCRKNVAVVASFGLQGTHATEGL